MYSLRNLISHEYFGIDYGMIWEITKKYLQQNLSEIGKVIEIEKTKE